MAFDPVLELALFIHYQEIIGGILLLAAGWFFLPRKRIFFASTLLTLALSLLVKAYFQLDRPCVDAASLVACPADFGFPSIHAALAGLVIVGSAGSRSFWFLAPASLFVGYSRVFLGVHSLDQVLAGLALGWAVYFLAWQHVKT